MKSSLRQYRKLLDEILDELIPANIEKNIPAAGTIGVGEFIDSRATEDPVLGDELNRLLSYAAQLNTGVNVDMVKALEARHNECFIQLLNLTYMGYYSRSDMRSLVGLGSWPVHPDGYEVPLEPTSLLDELTAPVRDRGPMYKDPLMHGITAIRQKPNDESGIN